MYASGFDNVRKGSCTSLLVGIEASRRADQIYPESRLVSSPANAAAPDGHSR
jgi:hypothetical protein